MYLIDYCQVAEHFYKGKVLTYTLVLFRDLEQCHLKKSEMSVRNKNLQGTYPIFHNTSLESNWIKVNTETTWQTLTPIYVFLSQVTTTLRTWKAYAVLLQK